MQYNYTKQRCYDAEMESVINVLDKDVYVRRSWRGLMITGDGVSDRLTPDTGKLLTLGKSHLLPAPTGPNRTGCIFKSFPELV